MNGTEREWAKEEEYRYLKWFAQNADFGPADSDVKLHMQEDYETETGNKVPVDWRMV